MPDKPKVVVLIDNDGCPSKASSNLSFNLEIIITTNPHEYNEFTAGLPYNLKPKPNP